MKYLGIILLFVSFFASSQELNCRVIVNAQQIQTTERTIFKEMETKFASFLNTTKWTDDAFNEEEVITCNLVITINEMPSIGVYKATAQILSSRPIYGTSYESVVMNFADRDWDFEYLQSQPLRFNENVFTDNLTSLLAYYAYTIIGFDYDTFSELGGEPYFDKAFKIVNNAQTTNYAGWKQTNNIRNRFWLIENIRNTQLLDVRKASYTFYRNGLDIITEKKEDAEKNILKALSQIQKAKRTRPLSILIISFMDANATELQQIYSKTGLATRRQVYTLLTNINPARTEEYKSLIK